MALVGYILLISGIIVIAAYFYLTRNFNYWKTRNIPYKKPIVFFGNLLDIVLGNEPTGQYIAKLYHEFTGPYFGFFAMDKPYLVIKDPEIIKRIMVKDFQSFPNRIFYNNEKVDPIVSNVLFGLKLPVWRSLRVKMSPVFSTAKVKMMMPLMVECADNMNNYLTNKNNSKVDTKDLAAKYTIDVIASCAFGISINSFSDENTEFIAAGRKLFNNTFGRTIQPLSYIFAHKLVKLFRLKFFDVEACTFLQGVFEKTIIQRELTNVKRNDLIDILIEIKKQELQDDEYKFNADRLVSQAIMFFAAGHETTSSTITFTLYELAMNQSVQGSLRDEIGECIARHGGVTYEAVQSMKYLHMVVSETLRKYPLTPFLQRECVEDYLVPETGLVIERGCFVLIPQHGLHWDPQYFPEPKKYIPERFSEENKVNINPYTYLPFGDGPRNCIGERFGLLNVKLGVLNVIRNFVVEPSSETSNPLIFGRAFLLQAVCGVPLIYRPIII